MWFCRKFTVDESATTATANERHATAKNVGATDVIRTVERTATRERPGAAERGEKGENKSETYLRAAVEKNTRVTVGSP